MTILRFVLAVSAAPLIAATAQAATYTVPTSLRTFINQNGFSYGYGDVNNYLAGNCGTDDCKVGEYRNQFYFSLPSFSGSVSSATLTLSAGQIILLQSPSITYTLTSSPSQTFAGLGTGTVYASGTFTTADSGTLLVFTLNQAALATFASGGSFDISGRVTSPTVFSGTADDQLIFGSTNNFPNGIVNVSSLEFTTNDVTPRVPEPATWAMMVGGFGLVGGALRHPRRKVSFA